MSDRDDFTQTTVRVLGQRAGYLCSNPSCRRPTSGPHSDSEKALITGIAAHICAAAEGGPRYDKDQTTEQRKSASNGLWLCGDCSKKIDTDWKPWPAERLHKMKSEYEAWSTAEGMIPALPEITLATRSGLRLVPKVPNIDNAMLEALREQKLTLRNPNRVELFNLKLRMYFPEAIVAVGEASKNAGTLIHWQPMRPPWTVEFVQAGGAVMNTEASPTPNIELGIPASLPLRQSCSSSSRRSFSR